MLNIFLKKKCPECGAKMENTQRQKATKLFILEEILFFGGISFIVFGRGTAVIVGIILIVLSMLIIIVFSYLIKMEYNCVKCGYTTPGTAK